MKSISDIKEELFASIEALFSLDEGALKGVSVEPPRDSSHGDLATNAAMVLAGKLRRKPREIALEISEKLKENKWIEEVEIAGPGFINLSFQAGFWQSQISGILQKGVDYGRSQIGGGEPVNIEFISANPTGPLHLGHCRGAIIGDALANLLDFAGFKICREYYINDAGGQIDMLARSVHLRYRQALGEEIGVIPEGLYPGDYLIPLGEALAQKEGDKWQYAPELEWMEPLREFAISEMMALIRSDIEALGIIMDVFSSERDLHAKQGVERAITDLRQRGLIYEGVLEPPKGREPEGWEPREQLLFRASQFGDDTDRPLQKSDKSWTYFASDIAYHYDKFQRGFCQMVDVWGADHGGYVKRMQSAVKAITGGEGSLDVKLCQLVKLFRAGEPVKMSKRAGDIITARDVIGEVGRDVVRFIMLTRKNDAPLDFDFAKVTEQSRDNPVFYVQYAHARCCSVMRNGAEELPEMDFSDSFLSDAEFQLLDDQSELDLIRLMGDWPRMVESAALAHEPHRIAYYLYDLASGFHHFWNKGKEESKLRFIQGDQADLTRARLGLVRAVAIVIASGLALMGVTPVEEMR